ncbi:MAG: hypothetical protein ACD_45C00701G0002 [uncultured bacterium]|nr:MAG: hypothetical protein ACD_45C00701G0002 [uncultured bacterium]
MQRNVLEDKEYKNAMQILANKMNLYLLIESKSVHGNSGDGRDYDKGVNKAMLIEDMISLLEEHARIFERMRRGFESKDDLLQVTFKLNRSQFSAWKVDEIAALNYLFCAAKSAVIKVLLQESDLLDCELAKIEAFCDVLRKNEINRLIIDDFSESYDKPVEKQRHLSLKIKQYLDSRLFSVSSRATFLLGSVASCANDKPIYACFFNHPLGQAAAKDIFTYHIAKYDSSVEYVWKRP